MEGNNGVERIRRYFLPMELLAEYDNEGDFQAAVITLFRVYGVKAHAIRNAFATKRGSSDLLVCLNGVFMACELKARDGTPSDLQLEFIEKIKAAGGVAAVCSCLADILDLIDAALRQSSR